MLHQFLKTMRDGDVQSLPEIARALGISPDMALHMAQELARTGYLEEVGAGCGESQPGCPDCPVNKTCQEIVRHWFLTAKGRAAAGGI